MIKSLASAIYHKLAGDSVINHLVTKFAKVNSWVQANKMGKLVFEYAEFLDNKHLNLIAKAYLSNDQIRGGYSANSRTLFYLEQRKQELTH